MGFNKFLSKIGVVHPEDAADDEPVYTEEDSQGPVEPRVRPAEPVEEETVGAKHSIRNSDKVVDFSASAASIRENVGSNAAAAAAGNMKVVVIQPRSLDDSQQIANCLKERRPVVINFEGVDDQLYRRILDFVSGTTYALDGNVNSISTRVWLFSPKNVNVSVNKQTNSTFSDIPWEKK